MPNLTLLEKAKLYQRKSPRGDFQPEVVDLSLAWMRGEISHTAVNIALGKETTQAYSTLANALRQAYREGRIICNDTSNQ